MGGTQRYCGTVRRQSCFIFPVVTVNCSCFLSNDPTTYSDGLFLAVILILHGDFAELPPGLERSRVSHCSLKKAVVSADSLTFLELLKMF